jgi:hypothetical protein
MKLQLQASARALFDLEAAVEDGFEDTDDDIMEDNNSLAGSYFKLYG